MNSITEQEPPLGMEYQAWMCVVCGFVYDESEGLPEEGIPPGTRWEELPVDWSCGECGAGKDNFIRLGS